MHFRKIFNYIIIGSDIQKSLGKISQSIGNLRMVVTDAASYNLTAFNKLSKQYKNLKWVTCYSHLLGNITQKITEFYKELMSLIMWLNDLFPRTSLDKLLNIPKPQKIIKTRWGSFLKTCVYLVSITLQLKTMYYQIFFTKF